jgi:hypothetical protein
VEALNRFFLGNFTVFVSLVAGFMGIGVFLSAFNFTDEIIKSTSYSATSGLLCARLIRPHVVQ